ncbi:MAG: 5-formyltetrahydrofolate cyclo-ligase [Eggerthellaceae bacterium]|jgi:5-formyltetrahydrofolate cyclo-ligase
MEDKEHLRIKVLMKRESITDDVREQKSNDICNQLENLILEHFEPQNTHPLVGLYSAMNSEVNLLPLIERGEEHGWRLCFPFMISCEENPLTHKRSRMEFFEPSYDDLADKNVEFLRHPLHRYSNPEVKALTYRHVDPREIDVLAVPLLAFDNQGHRMGYGGGNYDQFIPQLRNDAIMAGIAFDEQYVEEVPCEPHDQLLPLVLHA